MVIPYKNAALALFARMSKVFTDTNLELIYTDEKPVTPKVFLGYPADIPAHFVVVDDLPTNIDTSGGVSGFQFSTSFDIDIDCFAKHSDRDTARNAAYSYADAVHGSVMADGLLNRTVDAAKPGIKDLGSVVDEDKKYIYQFRVSITCRKDAMCPAIFKEIINAS